MKLIVTAGGQGTKLWPVSRNLVPKQFQPIIGTQTLFEQNILTLLKAYSPKDIFISTKRKYVNHVLKQAPQISFNNLIIEPDFEKNRGPAEGLAFLKLSIVAPDEPFMIIQSDVLRTPEEKFLKFIKECETTVKRERKFLTGGMNPTSAMLGVDYLKLGKLVDESNKVEFYECVNLVERPGDYKKTEKLISDIHVVIHANQLTCFPSMILREYEKHRPDWYNSLMKIKGAFGASDEESQINKVYESMEAGATEEVTKHIWGKDTSIIAITNFEWYDFGTWASVKTYMEDRGTKRKKNLILDSEDSFGRAPDGKLVVICGVDNAVVVDTEDALLVINKEKTGMVGDILKELKKKNLGNFL